MADKQVTVAVPEERVPEFYVWFAAFLEAEPGTEPRWRARGHRGPRGSRHQTDARAWSADDADQADAVWLYGKLAPPARALFDLLIVAPGERFGGEDIARRPIDTEGRPDGGTDYFMEPDTAAIFAAARAQATAPRHAEASTPRRGRHRR